MRRCSVNHCHGGSRLSISLLAFTSVVRETVSKQRISWPVDEFGHMLKLDV